MSVDGFHRRHSEPYGGYEPALAERFYGYVEQCARALHIEVSGLEHIPAGRALLVANHTFGWDVAVPIAAIAKQLGRRVWVLGEHAWWRVPLLRRIAAGCGVVDGNPANVDRLLASDQLVIVLPGGLREAVKPRELRYQLLWGKRYGFVRAALRNRAPIVPLACTGGDELFDFVGNPYERGRRWLGRAIPIPLPSRILPIPHLVRPHFSFGEAIVPEAGPEGADDYATVRRLRREVEGALHELIENDLARRAGIDLT